MERKALVALLTSLKMTKAWPLIFRLRDTRISRIWPNWEKMAYRDFFSSAIRKRRPTMTRAVGITSWDLSSYFQRKCSPAERPPAH
jgi:hypothetical protein